ncbi:DNA repair protein RadC [Brevundimonas sp. NPDC092305]|uniref:RadC family protein n=1 Tax=Brevundimonas sp. NPDC092305 TaxID=3363957 RepID=UPI00381ACEEA
MSPRLHRAAAAPTEAAFDPVDPEPSAFDDTRLLAVILSGGSAAGATLAAALTARFGSLGAVLAADAGELGRAGAGPAEVRRLGCLREAAVRCAREALRDRPVISSWSQLLAYVRTALANLPREEFRALFLDKRNVLIREELTASGTIDHAPVYPRELVRRALELSASAMILVHNHPSGDPTPSTADIDMTRKVIEAARVFDIQVHDHLIVGRHGTASFKSLGLI